MGGAVCPSHGGRCAARRLARLREVVVEPPWEGHTAPPTEALEVIRMGDQMAPFSPGFCRPDRADSAIGIKLASGVTWPPRPSDLWCARCGGLDTPPGEAQGQAPQIEPHNLLRNGLPGR